MLPAPISVRHESLLSTPAPSAIRLLADSRGNPADRDLRRQGRVRYQDVIAYKERIDAEHSKALDALAEQAQALKMGYE